MTKSRSLKAFSPVKSIIILLVLGGLVAGGWFGYTNYIEPMLNPYSKLIPAGLKEYAQGKNADVFVVIKNNQEIKDTILKSSPESAEQVNSFEGALAVGNTTKLSGAIVMSFTTAEKATELMATAKDQQASGPLTWTFEQKDKVIIATVGGGLDAMEGPIFENPAMRKLDMEMLDSQLIAYAAVSQMGTLGDLISSQMSGMFSDAGLAPLEAKLFPVVHAQDASDGANLMKLMAAVSLLPFIDDATIYLRFKDAKFDIKGEIRMLARNALADAPLIKSTLLKSGDIKQEDLEKSYSKALAMAPDITVGLQQLLDQMTSPYPGSKATIIFDDFKFSLEISFSKDVAEKQVQDILKSQMEAPAKGRDAARKFHLNSIVTALEASNLMNGNYPEKSGCAEDLQTELAEYLKGGTIPTDSAGPQTFGSVTCQSGYYYSSFGDKGYVLWGKMDLPENGNTSMTPQEFEEGVATGTVPPLGEPGAYFMLNKSYLQTSQPNATIIAPDTANEIPDSMLSEKFSINAKPVGNNTMGIEIKLAAAPGKTAQGAATVTNTSTQTGNVTIFASDKMTLRKPASNTNKEVGLWTTVDKTELTLASKETQTVNFSVAVPPGTAPGTYQGHLIFAYNNGVDRSTGIRITINVTTATVKRVKHTP